MQPQHYLPPGSLTPYIAFYGVLEAPEGFLEAYVSPPLAFSSFIFNIEGKSNATVNGALFTNHRYSVTGQVTGPVTGDIRGKCKSLLVFVQPFGLHQLFGTDMSSLTNTSMSLHNLLGMAHAGRIIADIEAAADHASIINVMNEMFLAQHPVLDVAPKAKQALHLIHERKGNVTVKEIERVCFMSLRSLERHFKLCIGLSPKDYIKIFRFKCLMNYIREHPGITWLNLCEQNGYYDQSHLTRYFTRYMKIRPTELVNADLEFINYLLHD